MKILIRKNYLQIINNSINSNLFRSLFVEDKNKQKDILKNGSLSCAYFVTAILKLFNLTKQVHATVKGTEKDLIESGWGKIRRPKIGAILIWEAIKYPDNSYHKHIGFYIGNKMAISNSTKKKSPQSHHYTYGTHNNQPKRKIESIYFHKKLGG